MSNNNEVLELLSRSNGLTFLAAAEDDSLKQITLQVRPLRGTMQNVIERLSATQSVMLPACGSSPLATHPIWARKQGNSTVAWGLVREIPILTGWRILAGGRMSPDFHRNEGAVMVKTWKPPQGIHVLVVSTFLWDAAAKEYWFGDGGKTSYLVLVAPGISAGFHRPPLANLYDDGRICMDPPRNRFPTIADAWSGAVNVIGATRFSADLSNRFPIEASDAAFSYNADGTQVPIDAKGLLRLCVKCNTTVYDGIQLPV